MIDAKQIEKLIAEMRDLKPLSPEWHAKAEEIERAFGYLPTEEAGA